MNEKKVDFNVLHAYIWGSQSKVDGAKTFTSNVEHM